MLVICAGPGPLEAQAEEIPVQEAVGEEHHEAEGEEVESLKLILFRMTKQLVPNLPLVDVDVKSISAGGFEHAAWSPCIFALLLW